ncbi:MAG TPA: Gfo/Idh/MocA family oxidoreductase [Longimicrobiales bacterium]|nr:Gfo/Idh/MocA family oxidoreductase [Longimicrobiales bacterium]
MTPNAAVGYAVVGLGWISQAAVLPAFANARRSSRLAALVSGDADKRRGLARRYDLPGDATFDYDDYDACLDRDDVDAVYIALPNHLHREYTVRAAEKGVHVLCEKPMAPAVDDCRAMIDACRDNGVKLMIAYRLHLDPGHLRAVELATTGAIGDPRAFTATFTEQVDADNSRLVSVDEGGGPVFDLGVYCINAARYLFRAEPERVWATRVSRRGDPRFGESEEMATCVLAFPGERHASFTCSFGAAPVSAFRLVGTEGDLRMEENAFDFRGDRELRVAGKAELREGFGASDQFGPQLAYFSDCILEDRDPEPDGEEGRIDVMLVRALYESMESGRPVEVEDADAPGE